MELLLVVQGVDGESYGLLIPARIGKGKRT